MKLVSPISQILVALEKAKLGVEPVNRRIRHLHDQEKKYPPEFFDLTGHASLHDLEDYYHEALKVIEAWRNGVDSVLKDLAKITNRMPEKGAVLHEIQEKLSGYRRDLTAYPNLLNKSHEAERKRFGSH